MSIYRSYVRSRKWTIRLITHAVDLALVNAWLEYKNEAIEFDIPKQKILDLLAFRQSVGEHLVYTRRAPKRDPLTSMLWNYLKGRSMNQGQ